MMRCESKKTEKKLLRGLCALAVAFALLFSLPLPLAHGEEIPPEQAAETAPQETVPEETVPEETVPEETVPEETAPAEQFRITFHYTDRTETLFVDSGSSFARMYPGIQPETLVEEKENHTFLGWYIGTEDALGAFDFSGPVTADVELYPRFRLNTYTVTFVLEGETLASATVEHGGDALLPEIPVREGYSGAWDHDGKAITADTVITLHYTREGGGRFLPAASDGNFGGAWLSETGESLAQAVPLTEQEHLALEEGADVTVRLLLSNGDAGASAGDRALAEGLLGDMKLCMYLDASLFKQVGREPETALEELDGGVTVSLVLPQSLLPEDGTARAFSVIRLHGGAAETVESVFNRETGVLSFTSDRFSLFAVACADAETPPPAETPATGDPFRPGLWAAVMVLCGLALAGLWQQKKNIL